MADSSQNRSVFMPDPASVTEGPFTQALQPPAQQQPQPVLGAGGGKALGAAYIGTQFLQGLAQSRIRNFQMQENAKIQKLQRLNSFMMYILQNPNLSPDDKNKAQQMYFKALGTDITAATANGGKGGGDEKTGVQHHFADIIKQVALGAVGGKLPKGVKNINPDEVIGQISGLLFDQNGKPKQPYNPQQQGIEQTEQALGRKLTDQEKQQLLGLPGNPFLEKKKQVEQALGRQLGKDEADKLLGVYVAPSAPHWAPSIPGDKVPKEVIEDATNNPIDRSAGASYKQDTTTGKYYLERAKAADKQWKQTPDSSTGWARVSYDSAGKVISLEKDVAPPSYLTGQTTTSVRFTTDQSGNIIEVPVTTTRKPNVPSAAPSPQPKAPPKTATPPGVAPNGAVLPPTAANAPSGARIVGHKPVSAAQVKSQQIASGARDAGIALSEMLPRLKEENPDYFGRFVGRTMGIQKFAGVQPDWVADVEAQAGSLEAFLTGVHNARGVKYVDHWKEILNNPYVNPEYTARVAKTLAAKI